MKQMHLETIKTKLSKMEKEPKEKKNVINFFIDNEPYSTTERELTAVQIMGLANVDPSNHYLVQTKGQGEKEISYKGNPSEPIKMHERMNFVTNSVGEPTTVS
jgi:hypothetical protein